MKSLDEVFLKCPGHICGNGQLLSNSTHFLKWKTTKLSTNLGKWLLPKEKKRKAHYTQPKETSIKSQGSGGTKGIRMGEIGQNQGVGLR